MAGNAERSLCWYACQDWVRINGFSSHQNFITYNSIESELLTHRGVFHPYPLFSEPLTWAVASCWVVLGLGATYRCFVSSSVFRTHLPV